ncbi:MAG: DUF1737 domain-containing protein [Methanosarcinaceae archaeon]|nr:DUF1737 domain-containing protein [Methanosarcinaceae archaeon]
MRKVIDYITVYDFITEDFDHEILEMLDDGYELFGYPYSGIEGEKLFNFQAMVKYDDA